MSYSPVPSSDSGEMQPPMHRHSRASTIAVIFGLAIAPLLAVALIFGPAQIGVGSPAVLASDIGATDIRVEAQQTLRLGDRMRAQSYHMSWTNSTGSHGALAFCEFKNFCVQGRPESSNTVEYFLDSAEHAEGDVEDFERLFRTCFRTIHPRKQEFGIRRAGESAVVVKGNTLAFLKDEAKNHPSAWARAWAPVASLFLIGRDTLRELGINRIHHVQMFEQAVKLNSWSAFVMNTAFSLSHRPHRPSWADDTAFVGTSEATCFERVLATRQNEWYFVDTQVAGQYQKQAFTSVDLPVERRPACEAGDLRVVYVKRERRVWNEDIMLQVMRERTPNVQIETIEEHTPYQFQVDLFASADILVSVHGAQLTNELFMRRGSGLVELIPHFYAHGDLARLSTMMQLDHVRLTSTTFPQREVISDGYVRLWDKAQSLLKVFTTSEACIRDMHCYPTMRELGVQVDMEIFTREYEELVDRVTSRC